MATRSKDEDESFVFMSTVMLFCLWEKSFARTRTQWCEAYRRVCE